MRPQMGDLVSGGAPCLARPCARRPPGRAAACRPVAARQSPGDDPSWSNPFKKRDVKSEEAARKALEGMFKGKKDILASLDTEAGGGGSGRGNKRKRTGGGGGGGGSGPRWQPPDWGQFGRGLRNRLAGASKGVLAVTGFVALFFAVPLIPQIFGFAVALLKAVLGLDGRARSAPRRAAVAPAQLAAEGDLGAREAAVIAKYGGGDAAFEPAGASGDSEDE